MSIRIVLVGTTHPGNIGAAARAMKNMGVSELTLVKPRYFPHDEAVARASGAEDILENATVVAKLEEALHDCIYVVGASARSRSIDWPCLNPRDCAVKLHLESARGVVAAVFGPEKSGLSNAQLDRCDTLLRIPTNPEFSSLNVAMAVQVLTYELRAAQSDAPAEFVADAPAATGEDFGRRTCFGGGGYPRKRNGCRETRGGAARLYLRCRGKRSLTVNRLAVPQSA